MQKLSLQSKKGVTAVLIGFMLLLPYHSYAQSNWQPHNNAELIAFLYGVIAQLQVQLEALRSDSGYDGGSSNSGGSNSSDGSVSTGRPRVVTGNTDYITANSAAVSADVDMRSYGYGNVFFVYGTGESRVNGVTRERSYNDIEIDERMNRFSVNNSYGGQGELSTSLYGLQAATKYYYRACIEYVDDGSRNQDFEIACGDVETFTTKRR